MHDVFCAVCATRHHEERGDNQRPERELSGLFSERRTRQDRTIGFEGGRAPFHFGSELAELLTVNTLDYAALTVSGSSASTGDSWTRCFSIREHPAHYTTSRQPESLRRCQ